jgi:hypothetical protein
VVHAAATRSSAAGGSAWTVSTTVDGQTFFTGKFAGPTYGLNGTGTLHPLAGPKRPAVTYQIVGGNFYLAFPHLPQGKKWVELTPADMQTLGLDEANLERQEGAQAFAFLRAASDQVKAVGHDTIDGEATTHYRLIVSVSALQKETKVLSAKLAAQQVGMLGSSVPTDVWIGRDGLLRRLTYSVDLAKATKLPKDLPNHGTLAYHFDFTRYGNVATPTAPPPDPVMTYGQLQAGAAPTAD